MQHATEISSGDSTSDSKVERAMRQRDYFLQQTAAGEQISATLRAGYKYGMSTAAALRPENVQRELRRAAKRFRAMTWAEVLAESLKLCFRAGRAVVLFFLFLLITAFRFVGNLMSDREEEGDGDPAGKGEKHQSGGTAGGGKFAAPPTPTFFRDYTRTTAAHEVDAFGIHIHHATSSRSTSPHPDTQHQQNGSASKGTVSD